MDCVRPKNVWIEAVKENDIIVANSTKVMDLNRVEWRK